MNFRLRKKFKACRHESHSFDYVHKNSLEWLAAGKQISVGDLATLTICFNCGATKRSGESEWFLPWLVRE